MKKSTENKRTEKQQKLYDAVTTFVESFTYDSSGYARWNTTSTEPTITKILVCLNTYKHQPNENNPSWVMPLYEAIKTDYESKKPDSKQYVERFYNAVMKLEETMRNDGWSYINNAIDDNSVDVLIAFIDVCKSTHSIRYVFDNYDFIKSNMDLTYRLLSDFDTSFRGEMKKLHNINDTFKIIECVKYEKDSNSWVDCFYDVNDGGTYYNNFNDALVCMMFGRFSNSALVLFEQNQKNIKEAEEEKRLKKEKSLAN